MKSNLPNHLSLVHSYVLFNKLNIIQAELSNFDIIALSETWLKPPMETSDITLSHYHSPDREYRIRDGYGGVIVYTKKSFSYKRRLDLEVLDVECIWIELTLPKNKIILVGLFDRPPNSISELTDRIESSIDLAVNTGIEDITITGDFNLNPFVPQALRTLNDIMCMCGLTQCIENPTRFTERSSSIIDLYFYVTILR